MKLLVIGATQGIGADTVSEALARGHTVRAMARGADALEPGERLEPFAGDATDPEDVARALSGVDAVIVTLGIRERLAMLWQEERLFSTATGVLLPLMAAHGPARLIVVTGFGAGESRAAMSAPERLGHKAILGRPYADKDRQEALVEASDLDWTIVRPVILTNSEARDTVRVLDDPATWRNGLVSRKSVARVLVDLAESGAHSRQGVVVAH